MITFDKSATVRLPSSKSVCNNIQWNYTNHLAINSQFYRAKNLAPSFNNFGPCITI